MSISAAPRQEVLAFLYHLCLIILRLLKFPRRHLVSTALAFPVLMEILSSLRGQLWQLFYVAHLLRSQPGILNHLVSFLVVFLVGVLPRFEVSLDGVDGFDWFVPIVTCEVFSPVDVEHIAYIPVLDPLILVLQLLYIDDGASLFAQSGREVSQRATLLLLIQEVLCFVHRSAVGAARELHLAAFLLQELRRFLQFIFVVLLEL